MTQQKGSTIMPGPTGLPVVGHAPAFMRDKLGFLDQCAQDFGDVVPLHIGGKTLLIRHPEDIKHVLVSQAGNYSKSPRMTSERGKVLSGQGLLTSFGKEHLRLRRMMQPCFHARMAATFDHAINACTQRILGQWQRGKPIDLVEQMSRLAQSVILRAVLGEAFASAEGDIDGSFAQAVRTRRQYIEYAFTFPLPFRQSLPTPIVLKYRSAKQLLEQTIAQQIKRRRQADSPGEDMLGLLMQARDSEGQGLDDEALFDEVLTLMITGYETIGEMLTWTLYLIAKHPQTEQELVSHITQVMGDQPVRAADVTNLPLVTQVLNESLRLYPPTWLYVRVAHDDDTLPSGATVAAGTKIYLCPWVVHHDARWWLEPAKFDPQRFADSAAEGRPRYAFFPFGAGPRVCIGEPLARLEGVLAVSEILRQYHLELAADCKVTPKPGITLRPSDPLMVTPHAR